MELKHTPWKAGPHPWPEQIGCCPLVGRPWSVHGTNHHNVAAAVSEDIARLIAAAPDMLSDHMENARILEFLCMEPQGRIEGGKLQALFGCLERSRAAIAKATGEASHGE